MVVTLRLQIGNNTLNGNYTEIMLVLNVWQNHYYVLRIIGAEEM